MTTRVGHPLLPYLFSTNFISSSWEKNRRPETLRIFSDIAATSNAAGKCLGGHISSTATANTILSTEVLRDPTSFGDIVRGLHVYGAKVLRDDAMVKAIYTID